MSAKIPPALWKRAREIYEEDPEMLADIIREGKGYSWRIYEGLEDSP